MATAQNAYRVFNVSKGGRLTAYPTEGGGATRGGNLLLIFERGRPREMLTKPLQIYSINLFSIILESLFRKAQLPTNAWVGRPRRDSKKARGQNCFLRTTSPEFVRRTRRQRFF